MPLAAGINLGPYELAASIGAGGMGEVYRAHDRRLGRDVAVKIIPASFAGDTTRVHRFEQEARAAAALNHPNILAVYDIGTHDGSPYIVTPENAAHDALVSNDDGLIPLALIGNGFGQDLDSDSAAEARVECAIDSPIPPTPIVAMILRPNAFRWKEAF